jgi:plastocyanin
MIDFAFQPANLTIKVGTTVKWVNNGAVPHEPSGTGFDTGTIQPGASATHTFDTEGTFPYKCLIHPSVMTGTITVNATGQSSGGTTTPTTPSSNTPLY